MVPQCQPEAEPKRQTEEPSMALLRPLTDTVPPVPLLTSGRGVQSLLTATQEKSLPGKVEAWTVPWGRRLKPTVALPGSPQWPAVTKPLRVFLVTEKPTEQRVVAPR